MKKKAKRRIVRPPRKIFPSKPTLRFTPTAWAKLLFLGDYGETEVGGFGISADDDPLLVEDVQIVQQDCSFTHVEFDDESVADFFDGQVDEGRRPEQFARIWIHTHPGDCPEPSITDEETFARVFGRSDWAVMFILAADGRSYARLRFNVGPGGAEELRAAVDYSKPFTGSDHDSWEVEYLDNVRSLESVPVTFRSLEQGISSADRPDTDWYESWFDYAEDPKTSKGTVP